MNENFKISPSEINKIKLLNQKDKNFRLENLKLFNQQGFPTRNQEDWKFSDINQIFSKNFKNLKSFKGWRNEIFGKLAKDLLEGKIAFGIKNRKIQIINSNN